MKKLLCISVVCLLLLSLLSCGTTPAEATDIAAGIFTPSVGDTKLVLGAEADASLAALGEARDYSESPSCAFEGLDKLYIYDGLRIETAPMKGDGKEYLYSVALTDDSHTTSKGIAIGADKEAVKAAYDGAEGYTSEVRDNEILCISSNGAYSLQFLFRSDRVTGIVYSVCDVD